MPCVSGLHVRLQCSNALCMRPAWPNSAGVVAVRGCPPKAQAPTLNPPKGGKVGIERFEVEQVRIHFAHVPEQSAGPTAGTRPRERVLPEDLQLGQRQAREQVGLGSSFPDTVRARNRSMVNSSGLQMARPALFPNHCPGVPRS